jgi:hypothetical protein
MKVFQTITPYGAGLLFTSAEKAYKAVKKTIENDITDYNIYGATDKVRSLEKDLETFNERYKDYLDGDGAFGTGDYWVNELKVY